MMKTYSAYKDSGVPWFGEVPQSWEVVRLGALLKERGEKNDGLKTENVLSLLKDVGVINYEDKGAIGNKKSENIERYKIVHEGDIVVNSMNVIIGSVGMSPEYGSLSPVYYVLRAEDDSVYMPYYDFVFKIRPFQDSLKRIGYGILDHRMKIPMVLLKKEPLPKPPIEEQKAIVAFLEEQTAVIDKFITNKRRLIELLEEQKQAVINTAVTQGLDTAVPRKPSGIDWLGDIPAHWKLKRLKHISPELSVGVVVTPSKYYDELGTVPFLFGGNIAEGQISLKNVRKISEESNEILSKSRLNAGDLVTVRVGYPGITAVIPSSLDECNCASMMIIRQSSKFNSDWLCYVMNSPIIKEQIEVVKYGAAQKQFNIGHAVNFIVPLPPKEEQQQVLDFIKIKTAVINAAIERTQREIDLIEEYRTTLIAHAVTGKIDVRPHQEGA